MTKYSNSRKDFFIVLILSFLISLSSGYAYFSFNNSDLELEKGIYNSVDYLERTTKTTSKIKLNIENKSFIIPSYIEGSFKFKEFKKEVFKGDSIAVFIDDDGFVSQIESKRKLYIDEDKRDNLIKTDNRAAIIICLVFLSIFFYSLFSLLRY